MLNQVVMVGRLTSDPEINEVGNDRKVATITLAVQRSYKNAEGVYETDFIKCILWNGIAENTAEYCKKGDVIEVKGRIQTTNVDDKIVMEVVAEKISFLSSRKEEDRD